MSLCCLSVRANILTTCCVELVRAFRSSLQPLMTAQSSKWDIHESHSSLSNAAKDSGITTGLFCDTEVDVPEPEEVALSPSFTIIWTYKKTETTTTGLHDKPLVYPANIPQTQLRQQVSQQLTNKDYYLTPRIAKLNDPCGYVSKLRVPRRLGSSIPPLPPV